MGEQRVCSHNPIVDAIGSEGSAIYACGFVQSSESRECK